jgi:hypothetical protein
MAGLICLKTLGLSLSNTMRMPSEEHPGENEAVPLPEQEEVSVPLH